jgi:fructose-1,6-bisphosphatase I
MANRTAITGKQSVITAQQHILEQQQTHFPDAGGAFSWLLSGMTLATKMIQAKIRYAGLVDILGSAGETNVQGEPQQKLDVYANQALLQCLRLRDKVAILVSEENEEPVTFHRARNTGKYVIFFDPLDGSLHVDVNVSVGAIFAVFPRPAKTTEDVNTAVLRPGCKHIAAGYVLYGSSTILVYTAGNGVFGFTLDTDIGAYVLSPDKLRMPRQGNYYSVNEAQSDPAPYQDYLSRLRTGALGQEYSSRHVGSLAADFHRTLLKGGVFVYPPTKGYIHGKVQLLYEANPLAFVAEQAGGTATSGDQRILEIQPREIHQRAPVVLGSRTEVEELHKRWNAASPTVQR